MSTILDQIVASKRQEVAESKARLPATKLTESLARLSPPRDFRAALESAPGMAIIAEVKKASPSAGVLREDFEPVGIARSYAHHGANALSVLTDEPFFQGRLGYLTAIRQAVNIPLLRKDFILDPYQVLEARVAGADAVLLIAEILPGNELPALIQEIHRHGMQALVEIHDGENLARVIAAGARLVGINNRDLRTFVTRLEHTLELAPRLPEGCCLVSESGIRSREDVLRLQAGGVRAILVGETFMRSPDPGAKLAELRGIPDGAP